MKKYWKLLLCAALTVGAFTACEDVPAPYNIPTENPGNNTPPADYILSQDFTRGWGDFQNYSDEGALAWSTNARYGALITGYDDFDGDGNKENKPGVTYLFSGLISLAECDSAYISIEQAINYAKTTITTDHYLFIAKTDPAVTLVTEMAQSDWHELPLNFDGLGTSFTYLTQAIQIPQEYIGQNIRLALKHIAHNDYSSTWEVKNLRVIKGTAPEAQSTTPVDLVGSGTKDDPYDVPSTIKLIAAGPPSTPVYTKGIVSQVDEVSEQYGNATYYISNDGTTTDQLLVYRGLGVGGRRFGAGDLRVGDQVIVYGVVVNYAGSKPEFTQGNQLYKHNDEIDDSGVPSGDAKGSGTLEDPFNAAKANEVASALASGAESSQAYYIKGKVASIATDKDGNVQNFDYSTFGNATFYISDDGTTNEFYVYRSLYLGNQKWTSGAGPVLQVGDEVIVYAKLTNYRGNTPETVQGATYLYSLNGETGGTTPDPQPSGDAKGSGTLADPYNSVAANNIATALAANAQSDQAYYIKGKVVSVKEKFAAQYGNCTFFISDDGTTAGQFQVFRAYYLGNKKWVNGNGQVNVGDEVIVYAKLTNYQGNTPETVQGKEGQDHGYVYSINGKTEDDGSSGGGGEDPEPSEAKTLADFTNGDFETWASDSQPTGWKSASTASNATLAKSTDAHGGSFAVCVKGASQNKRLAYEEMELEAGTYNCSFWTKAATGAAASLCPGYAVPGSSIVYNYDKADDGKNKYVNDIGATWQQVTYSFTLTEKTVVCLVIMNSKTTGTDLLIDDFTITKE